MGSFLPLLSLKDNEKLRQKMSEMEKRLAVAKQDAPKKPPSKPVKPNPKVAGRSKGSAPPDGDDSGDDGVTESGSDRDGELSHAAKQQRLRRLCERKGSGKLMVPEEIHQLWAKGGHTRNELMRMLEDSGYDKEGCINVCVSFSSLLKCSLIILIF